jgi:hypothetical protein
MIEDVDRVVIDSEGTLGQRALRRPYVKPFLRDLDVLDTHGKEFTSPAESTFVGPS